MTYPHWQQPYDPRKPPYTPQPGYPYALPQVVVAQNPPTSGVSTASMVIGIIGALGGWCMLGIPCLIAIVLGHVGMSETKDGSRGGRGMAVTGLILGYLFIVPWAVFFFLA